MRPARRNCSWHLRAASTAHEAHRPHDALCTLQLVETAEVQIFNSAYRLLDQYVSSDKSRNSPSSNK